MRRYPTLVGQFLFKFDQLNNKRFVFSHGGDETTSSPSFSPLNNAVGCIDRFENEFLTSSDVKDINGIIQGVLSSSTPSRRSTEESSMDPDPFSLTSRGLAEILSTIVLSTTRKALPQGTCAKHLIPDYQCRDAACFNGLVQQNTNEVYKCQHALQNPRGSKKALHRRRVGNGFAFICGTCYYRCPHGKVHGPSCRQCASEIFLEGRTKLWKTVLCQEHLRPKSRCVACCKGGKAHGGSLCAHARRKEDCILCSTPGTSICIHGKRTRRCRECLKPNRKMNLCSHQRLPQDCLTCSVTSATTEKRSQRSVCVHGKRKRNCPACGGRDTCVHGHQRAYCAACQGTGVCQHGRRKHYCRLCIQQQSSSQAKRPRGRPKNSQSQINNTTKIDPIIPLSKGEICL